VLQGPTFAEKAVGAWEYATQDLPLRTVMESEKARRFDPTWDPSPSLELAGSTLMPGRPTGLGSGPARLPRKPAITAVSLREMPLDQAIAIAKTDAHILPSPKGGYVGAPEWVQTPADLAKMRADFDAQVEQGLAGANWYQRAHAGVVEMAGADPARQSLLAQEKALWSAQSTPDVNLGYVLTGHAAYEAGVPLEKVRTGAQARTYTTAREAEEDIKLGKKTGVYERHLDPTKESPTTGTNDIWHARALGYTKKGKPWNSALTAQQHAFMDTETVLAVDRANAKALGGRTDWTPGEIQAAPWVFRKTEGLMQQFGWDRARAAEEATKTYIDYFGKYTAFGTHEITPGVGTGQVAFDPQFTWADPQGHDVIYGALGVYDRPTVPATGVFEGPLGLETNPALVARPMVGHVGKAGKREVDPASRALMNVAEGLRAYVDVQNAGAWSKPIFGQAKGQSASLFVELDQPLTIQQIGQLRAVGAQHGLPDVVDYGRGAMLTNFAGGDPKALTKSLKQYGGLSEAVQNITGTVPDRVKLQSGYLGYEEAWRAGEGSGAATRLLKKFLSDPDAPAALGKLDRDIALRRRILEKLDADAAVAQATGQPVRQDVQLAREIIYRDGLTGLFAALKKGAALPAVALIVPVLQEHQDERM
jgi:hypothetical protein